MIQPTRFAKVTLRTPLGMKQGAWSHWRIVLDGHPIGDFEDSDEVTVEIPEGLHSLSLRRPLLGSWYSSSQILYIEVTENIPIVLRAGSDNRIYLLCLLGFAAVCSKSVWVNLGFAEWYASLSVPFAGLLCAVLCLALLKGITFKLTLVDPKNYPKNQKSKILSANKLSVSIDPTIQRLSEQYAQRLSCAEKTKHKS